MEFLIQLVKGSARARFFVLECSAGGFDDTRDLGDWDWGWVLEMESIGTYPSSWASRVRDNIFECDEGSWVLGLCL